MGNKEKVLEVLKANREGLTFKELDDKCDLGHDLYAYLSRLGDDGLVDFFRPKGKEKKERKVVGFRATEKAWEEERKEKALELIEITKDLITKGKITDKQEEVLKEICQL